jgi:hypothetical protein
LKIDEVIYAKDKKLRLKKLKELLGNTEKEINILNSDSVYPKYPSLYAAVK